MQMVSRNTSYIPRPFKTRRNANPSFHPSYRFPYFSFFLSFSKKYEIHSKGKVKKEAVGIGFFFDFYLCYR